MSTTLGSKKGDDERLLLIGVERPLRGARRVFISSISQCTNTAFNMK
jgi:hypothetical protein